MRNFLFLVIQRQNYSSYLLFTGYSKKTGFDGGGASNQYSLFIIWCTKVLWLSTDEENVEQMHVFKLSKSLYLKKKI